MRPWHNLEDRFTNQRKALLPDTDPLLDSVVNLAMNTIPTLVQRSPADTTTSASTSATRSCGAHDNTGTCEKSFGPANTTVPIVLGVVIPVVCATIAFVLIWWRNHKKQKREDEMDKHAALDFGLGEFARPEKGRKGKVVSEKDTEFSTEKSIARSRGMSIDLGSPYVLPGPLGSSDGSFHSMSRSAADHEGPYRSANWSRPVSASRPPAYQSRPASGKDSASVFTQSSSNTSVVKSSYTRNGPSSSRSSPASGSPPDPSPISIPDAAFILPGKPVEAVKSSSPAIEPTPRLVRQGSDQQGAFVLPPRKESKSHTQPLSHTKAPKPTVAPRQPMHPVAGPEPLPTPPTSSSPASRYSPKSVSRTAPPRQQSKYAMPPASVTRTSPSPVTPKRNNQGTRLASIDTTLSSSPVPHDQHTYADVLGIAQKQSTSPIMYSPTQFSPVMPTIPEPGNPRSLPSESPPDNAEQRANKVHSFYKEYFDDSTGGPSSRKPYEMGYYEDYDYRTSYLNGAAIFDPETNQFIIGGAPYAEPITRRAMTPPPRAPPQFRGAESAPSSAQAPRTRGSRAYSATAGTPARGRPARRAPPPAPLTTLPTPHLLRDDSSSFSPIDFAPRMTFKDRVAGKPASRTVEQIPYQGPGNRAFSPLASSFDGLIGLPSPHALRKSASFTGLDFARAPRYRTDNNSSDNGSVRSGRSNISAAHLANIRAGAYRVSRIPKEFVGTKDDFAAALKPSWDQRM